MGMGRGGSTRPTPASGDVIGLSAMCRTKGVFVTDDLRGHLWDLRVPYADCLGLSSGQPLWL